MAPPNPPVNGLPGHPSLPANPFGQQPQQQPQSQPAQPQMMQYLQMQMAMQQQLMQSQAYGYGGYYNPQMMMRQSLFQPVSYQPVQNEQGYTYSSTYLEQQQQQPPAQPGPSTLPSAMAVPQPDAPRPAKKARTQPTAPTNGTGGAWRNCVQDGCAFVGSEKDVALHEQDRHLIYKKRVVERSEEEEAALKKAGPAPPIPGTAIRLETEEDIAKWIAQRRARWPTAARVEEKETERQEKIARGEIDPNASGRGRRGRGGKAGRGARGRGGAEAGTAGRTRDAGYAQRAPPPPSEKAKKQEGSSSGSESSDSSDSDSDEDSDAKSDAKPDDRPAPRPTEQEVKMAQSPPSTKKERGICKFFAKTGRCRNGGRCHFLHERQGQRQDPKPARPQPSSAFALTTSANRPSLLAALLENPINQTLSNISQALQFLVDNDFLDGVELNPGEYEEAQEQDAGTRKLVQILETDQKPSAEGVAEVVAEPIEEHKMDESKAQEDRPKESTEAMHVEPTEAETAIVPP